MNQDITTLQSRFEGINYTTIIQSDDHQIITDEPLEEGGQNLGFDPFELVLAALATCTTATMKMYADRKGWKIDKLDIKLSMIEKDKIQHIQSDITLEGDLDEEQRKRMLVIAQKCPVHKILTNPNVILTEFV
jgi:putative redox protein